MRHISQNQNTNKRNRKVIHPRRNRNFQTPRVQFNVSQPPTSSPLDFSSSTISETPPTASQKSISNTQSTDYLGSTPTSEQFRENLFHYPTTTERPPYWVTNKNPNAEPNLVNNRFDVSFDSTLSILP